MAHHRPAPSTSLRGKQAAVQEGQFLQFLRSVGYRDELPPSTVAWLETAPVFKFLAGKLSADNFVSAQEQQEYNECMLARGPDADLYDAVGDGLSSDGGGDDGEGGGGGASARAAETDPFLASLTDDEVAAALQEEEAYVQRLEQQVASLRAMSGALSATAQQAGEQQGPRYFTLKAHAGDELAAARSEAAHLNSELNATLQQLEEVSGELCKLLAYPHAWLLCAAPDRAAYEQVDSAANNQYGRATHLLDASEVAMHLHTSVSPAGPAAAAVADHSMGGSLPTPRGLGGQQQQQQQQQASMLTPRGGQSKDWAAALQDATKKRREAHAARNAALMTEMCRQRHAFALALQDVVAASVAEAGVQAQLAAAQQVRSCSGDFAALLRQGPAAVGHLASRLLALEGDRVALERGTVAALTVDVARLNDNHIIVGDYDRQLAKMDAAFSRRQGVLRCLLHRGAVHLLLLLLGLQELRRLAALGQELQRAAHVMEGHVAAAEARISRCVAVFKALDDVLSLSNLRPEDSFSALLLAAAEGRFQLQDEQQSSGPTAAAAAGGEQQAPGTPGTPSWSGGVVGGGGAAARTPSYAPSAGLADKLQQLSGSLQQGATSLQRLLDLLPQQLEQHKQAACELHRTAFPPGQPLYVPGSSSGSGGLAAAASAAPPSAAGSTWGGSQSAAPSVRSTHHSTSSGGGGGGGAGQHPRPLLVLPEVAEAEAALDAGLKQLQGDANRAITKQNSMVAAGRSKEAELERRVMALFFGAPDDLAGVVDSLHTQLDQAAL